ncbi:MAG TPA: hypothetical protein VK395_11135 [Gemmataceae bacterium]|nr:hypothetical protein [Gemmataceae bacterium]
MRRIMLGIVVMLAISPPLRADDKAKEKPAPDKPKTGAEQYQALVKEYDDALKAWMKSYQAAKTDEDRRRLPGYPTPQKYEKQILDLVEKNPHDAFALDALIWVVQHNPGNSNRAVELIAKDHVQDKRVGALAGSLVYSPSSSADVILRAILQNSTDHKEQGPACFGLAKRLKTKADRAQSKDTTEAEKYFQQTIEKYADVKYYGKKTLGDAAKGALFEMHHLSIGKPAPEIEGADVDNKKFKLSDYRGKVVLLDFWGNW